MSVVSITSLAGRPTSLTRWLIALPASVTLPSSRSWESILSESTPSTILPPTMIA